MKLSDILNYCPVCSSDTITVTNINVEDGFPTLIARVQCSKCISDLTIALENKVMN